MVWRERSGSVVECLSRDQGVVGSGLTVLCVLGKTQSSLNTGSTQEDPSRYN